jgi:hypothetical protein
MVKICWAEEYFLEVFHRFSSSFGKLFMKADAGELGGAHV